MEISIFICCSCCCECMYVCMLVDPVATYRKCVKMAQFQQLTLLRITIFGADCLQRGPCVYKHTVQSLLKKSNSLNFERTRFDFFRLCFKCLADVKDTSFKCGKSFTHPQFLFFSANILLALEQQHEEYIFRIEMTFQFKRFRIYRFDFSSNDVFVLNKIAKIFNFYLTLPKIST